MRRDPSYRDFLPFPSLDHIDEDIFKCPDDVRDERKKPTKHDRKKNVLLYPLINCASLLRRNIPKLNPKDFAYDEQRAVRFTMLPNGQVYLGEDGDKAVTTTNHIPPHYMMTGQTQSNARALAAGNLYFRYRDGYFILDKISNKSGHLKPSNESLKYILLALVEVESKSFIIDTNLTLEFHSNPSKVVMTEFCNWDDVQNHIKSLVQTLAPLNDNGLIHEILICNADADVQQVTYTYTTNGTEVGVSYVNREQLLEAENKLLGKALNIYANSRLLLQGRWEDISGSRTEQKQEHAAPNNSPAYSVRKSLFAPVKENKPEDQGQDSMETNITDSFKP